MQLNNTDFCIVTINYTNAILTSNKNRLSAVSSPNWWKWGVALLSLGKII